MKALLSFISLLALLSGCSPESQLISNTVTCNNDEYILSLPEDIYAYRHAMAEFSQIGGTNPLQSTSYKNKCIPKTSFKDLSQTSAQEIFDATYKDAGRVTHFRIKNNIAYVELKANTEGWAGVSASLAAVNPIIKRNLFLNSKVEEVIVGEIK